MRSPTLASTAASRALARTVLELTACLRGGGRSTPRTDPSAPPAALNLLCGGPLASIAPTAQNSPEREREGHTDANHSAGGALRHAARAHSSVKRLDGP